MITDTEYKAKEFNGNREKRSCLNLRRERDEVSCNRMLPNYYLTEPYFLKNVETTKFSVNEPLLLNRIHVDYIKVYHDGKDIRCNDVPTEVTVVEVSDSADSNTKVEKFKREVT